MAEATVGDAQAIGNRLVFCNSLPLLALPADALESAQQLVAKRAVPAKAFTDALHIATAALHEVDLIASWNFKHIAGPMARRKIEQTLAKLGVFVPAIATPEEILESTR